MDGKVGMGDVRIGMNRKEKRLLEVLRNLSIRAKPYQVRQHRMAALPSK